MSKIVFRDTLLTFGQCPYVVAKQTITKGEEVGMHHGTIDIIAGSDIHSSTYVVCMMASSKAYTALSEPNNTTVETPLTFGML